MIFGGDWEFVVIVQAGVEEGALPMHFKRSNKGVPVWNRAPTGPGMQIHAGESKGGWDQCGGGLAIRSKSLAIEDELGIEFTRSPRAKDFANGGLIDSENVRNRFEIRSKRDDGAD